MAKLSKAQTRRRLLEAESKLNRVYLYSDHLSSADKNKMITLASTIFKISLKLK